MRLIVLVFISILVACGVTDVRKSVIDGEDYRLPSWVAPEPFSGYAGSPPGPRMNKRWHASWADLEPRQGEYNWNLVEEEFAKARAGGYKVKFYLKSIEVSGGWPEREPRLPRHVVPDWVLTGLGAPTDTIGWNFNIEIIAGWHPKVRDAFNTFIRAFGDAGFPQRDELFMMYVHGVSHSYGEEFWMQPATAQQLERTMGFSPDILRTWIKSRMDAYADAFKGVEYKIAWNGSADAFRFNDYDGIARELLEYAWSKGFGNRMGIIERHNGKVNEPATGQRLTPDGYLTVDESLPPIANGSAFGDENEEYGDRWIWRYGPVTGESCRYRQAMLRGLQSLYRVMTTSEASELVNPPLSEYARLSFGKSIVTTPDAWAYLRESPITIDPGVMKNFERWLVQRDLPGGMTVPTERTDRTYNAGLSPYGQWYDFLARRTDLQSDNPCMYFNIDNRFQVNGPVELKVEILDNSRASWHIVYTDTRDTVKETPVFQNHNDGNVRTVTFQIPDVRFANALEHQQDFKIMCNGPDDVTVRWVRVVRLEKP